MQSIRADSWNWSPLPMGPGNSACSPGSSTPMAPPAEFWGPVIVHRLGLTELLWWCMDRCSHTESLKPWWFNVCVYTMVHCKCILPCALYTIQINESHSDLKSLCLSWTIFTIRYNSHYVHCAHACGGKLRASLTQSTKYLTNHQENFIQVIYMLKIKYKSKLLFRGIQYQISNIYRFSSNCTGCLQTVVWNKKICVILASIYIHKYIYIYRDT